MNSADDILVRGLEALAHNDRDIEGLIVRRLDEILEQLAKYMAEIELFNPVYGLVSVRNRQELVTRHILDSLAPLGVIKRLLAETGSVPQIADIGSGAGLPGIPLAIAMPHAGFTLVERMGRRAGFLRNTQAALGLSNTAVEEQEMEKTAAVRFALVTFRAFKPLEPKLLKALFRCCVPGGVIAAYKGRREKIAEEMAGLEKISGPWEAIPCPVPMLDEERHLLVIKRPRTDAEPLW